MAFNNTIIAQVAGAVFGVKLGNATMNAVLQQASSSPAGVNGVINDAFNSSYAGSSNAAIASIVVGNLGLTGANATNGTAYLVQELGKVATTARGAALANILSQFSSLTSDPAFGADATAFNAKVASALTFASTAGTADGVFTAGPPSTSFNLATTQDNLTGTPGDDTFNAFQIAGANTLNSGDIINGGAGTDTLNADLASGTGLTTPHSTNIEIFSVRSQERATSTGDNNIPDGTSGTTNSIVTIDAQRMVNIDRFESNNSRADLKIEDVRIPDAEITKDTTIAMVSTDPGNVDFAVYFDQHSLRAFSGNAGSLRLDVLDVFAYEAGLAPLKDSPYDTVRFLYDGTSVTLSSTAINDAQTYLQLRDAFAAEIAKQPALSGISVTVGSTFTVPGRTAMGNSIVLSATNHTFGVGTWVASQGVPPLTLFYTNQDSSSLPNQDLITSNVVLDDVGRGSMGGDLVIGGLSVGETSSSKGVERFNITVERSSKLQVISSTANTLQEVVLTQGAKVDQYNTTGNVGKPGALTVVGRTDIAAGINISAVVASNGQNDHEGVASVIHGGYGFTDVRLIDGSALAGKFTFDAQITDASFGKYIDVGDTQPDPTGDNGTTVPGQRIQRADFKYSGGSNDDRIFVVADTTLTGSNSQHEAGREDFSLVINGNAGNDDITFRMVGDTGLLGNTENWYINQKQRANVTINGGIGDDTVKTPGAGDVRINLDAGNDTAYTDNTGLKAQWVFNTAVQTTPDAGSISARNVGDIQSSANTSYNLYKGTLTVQFLGTGPGPYVAASTAPLVSKSVAIGFSGTTFRTNDLFINQAIKNAINTDPVLNKLLVAADGPSHTLIVTSLIDGARVADNLRVNIATTTDTLTATEISNLNTAWSPGTAFVSSADAILAMGRTAPGVTYFPSGNNLNNFDATGDYAAAITNNGGAGTNAGSNSVTTSDNTITGGAGNDVIVLGTTVGGNIQASSNETIVYSAPFDNDTIVNFAISGNGVDKLSFTGLGGTSAGTYVYNGAIPVAGVLIPGTTTNDTLIYAQALDLATNSTNDTAAEIAAFYTDTVGAGGLVNKTYVYVAVNTTTNVGFVYSIVDAPGATSNVTASFMGTIDLAEVTWASLTTPNFS